MLKKFFLCASEQNLISFVTMPQCCVFGCKNASGTTSEENGKHVSCHLFPAKVSLRNLWNKRINRVNFTASKFSVVCSVHFKEEDVKIHMQR